MSKYVFTYTIRIDGKLAPYHHIQAETEEEMISKLMADLGIKIEDWSSDVALRAMQEGRKK